MSNEEVPSPLAKSYEVKPNKFKLPIVGQAASQGKMAGAAAANVPKNKQRSSSNLPEPTPTQNTVKDARQ